jgi:superfamily II DNA or RNA helicase
MIKTLNSSKTEKDLIKFKYDGAYCEIIGSSDELLQNIARLILTYTDHKISYANKFSRKTYLPSDQVCLLKNNKFFTGLLPRVSYAYSNRGLRCEFESLINGVLPVQLELPDHLWEHQKRIIAQALDVRRGVVQSATGSGKTLTAAWLAKHFPTENILFVVPDEQILHHNVRALTEVLEENIGQISGKTKRWERVTVGIINSLFRAVDTNPEKFKEITVLIVDEAHRCGNTKMYKTVCNSLVNTGYRIGFSATGWREAGDNLVMEGLLGPTIIKVTPEELTNLGVLVKPKFYMVSIPDSNKLYSNYSSISHTYLTPNQKPIRLEVYRQEIINNPIRNRCIADITKWYLQTKINGSALILVENIEHGEIIQDLLQKELGIAVPYVHGKSHIREREEVLEKLNSQELKVVVASAIFNEGKDIKSLGMLIIAGGGQASSKLLQQVGRVTRTAKSKTSCLVFDFFDEEQFYLSANSVKRKKTFDTFFSNSSYKVKLEKLSEVLNDIQQNKGQT